MTATNRQEARARPSSMPFRCSVLPWSSSSHHHHHHYHYHQNLLLLLRLLLLLLLLLVVVNFLFFSVILLLSFDSTIKCLQRPLTTFDRFKSWTIYILLWLCVWMTTRTTGGNVIAAPIRPPLCHFITSPLLLMSCPRSVLIPITSPRHCIVTLLSLRLSLCLCCTAQPSLICNCSLLMAHCSFACLRTDTEYEDALIGKLFVFNFINSYASQFYISFVKNYIDPKARCNPSCMDELAVSLTIICGAMTLLTSGLSHSLFWNIHHAIDIWSIIITLLLTSSFYFFQWQGWLSAKRRHSSVCSSSRRWTNSTRRGRWMRRERRDISYAKRSRKQKRWEINFYKYNHQKKFDPKYPVLLHA